MLKIKHSLITLGLIGAIGAITFINLNQAWAWGRKDAQQVYQARGKSGYMSGFLYQGLDQQHSRFSQLKPPQVLLKRRGQELSIQIKGPERLGFRSLLRRTALYWLDIHNLGFKASFPLPKNTHGKTFFTVDASSVHNHVLSDKRVFPQAMITTDTQGNPTQVHLQVMAQKPRNWMGRFLSGQNGMGPQRRITDVVLTDIQPIAKKN